MGVFGGVGEAYPAGLEVRIFARAGERCSSRVLRLLLSLSLRGLSILNDGVVDEEGLRVFGCCGVDADGRMGDLLCVRFLLLG